MDLSRYSGLRITVSHHALKDTDQRLFPESKNRSARILKKLIKRHGGTFRKGPAIFQTGPNQLICHPALYEELKRQLP